MVVSLGFKRVFTRGTGWGDITPHSSVQLLVFGRCHLQCLAAMRRGCFLFLGLEDQEFLWFDRFSLVFLSKANGECLLFVWG